MRAFEWGDAMAMTIGRVLLVACMLAMASAHAIIVKLTDLNTMAKRSDIVVHGYVGDQSVVNDDMGRLITLTDIEVIDGFYGAKTGEIITMYQVGGSKNGVIMPMLGGQRYQLGQEVVVFGLKLDNTYVSYGAGQGKLDVIRSGTHEMVVEDLGDVSAMTRDGNGAFNAVRPMPLSFSSKELILQEIQEMTKGRK